MRRAFRWCGVVFSVFVLPTAGSASAAIRYVDTSAPPGGDGTSWATAGNDLQQALTTALPGDEIHVGPGTYRPTATVGDRSASFTLRKGMALRGGYAGYGSAHPDEQNPAIYVTTLSGDIAGDDGPSFTNRGDNAYHVVTVVKPSSGDPACTLDAVTIVAGQADGGAGGGLRATGSSTLNRCIFRDNYGAGGGAASINDLGQVTDCRFEMNKAQSNGGAVQLLPGTSFTHTFRRCTFRGNTASGAGGAVEYYFTNSLFVNCTFEANSASGSGGAIKGNYYPLTCINCGFFGNTSNAAGGGLSVEGDGALIGCVFSGNTAGWYAGAANGVNEIYNCTIVNNRSLMGSPAGIYGSSNWPVRNCILWGNSSTNGSDQIAQLAGGSGLTIANSTVQGWTGSLGGAANNGINPMFVLPDGSDGLAGTIDDDLRLQFYSPAADSGDNSAVPADSGDVDGNGNTAEPLPLDIDGSPRISDDPTALPAAAIVNRGAYENVPDGPQIGGWKSLAPHSQPTGPPEWLALSLDPASTGNGMSGPVTEPRMGGPFRLEVQFDYPVQLKAGGSVSIVVQQTVNGTLLPPIPFPVSTMLSMADAATLRIELMSTISSESCCTIDVANAVIDSRGAAPIGDTDCMLRVLLGDVTGSGDVTLSDTLLVNARAGTSDLDGPAFDINRNGVIDAADALTVKNQVKSPPRQALCP